MTRTEWCQGVRAIRDLAWQRQLVVSNGQPVTIGRLSRWLEMVGRMFLILSLRRQIGSWPTILNITSGYGPEFASLDRLAVSCAQEVALQTEQKRQQLAG